MLCRYIVAAVMTLVPMVSYAATGDQGSQLQAAGSAAVSTQSSSILQPAAGDTGAALQPTGAAAQSQDNQSETLQSPATSDQVKLYIKGDIDSSGAPSARHSPTWLLYVCIILVAATLVTSILWLWQRRILKQISS